MMKAKLIKIVVPKRLPGHALMSTGTKVFTEEGAEISGINKITLVAEFNQPWRAVIECIVAMQDMEGIEAEIISSRPLPPPDRMGDGTTVPHGYSVETSDES